MSELSRIINARDYLVSPTLTLLENTLIRLSAGLHYVVFNDSVYRKCRARKV